MVSGITCVHENMIQNDKIVGKNMKKLLEWSKSFANLKRMKFRQKSEKKTRQIKETKCDKQAEKKP